MTSSNSDFSNKHVEEWCLAYLEDLLSADERHRFEEHLEQCPDCAKQTQDISRWVTLLKSNKDALCPEEWELFDYASGCEDVTGVLASHVARCPSCRKTVEDFRTRVSEGSVPDTLWKRMEPLHDGPAKEALGTDYTWLQRLWERLTGLFTPPLALAGAVAAAILVVVLLYPYHTSRPLLALSEVTWAPDRGALKLMGERGASAAAIKKERLAIIVYFKDFKPKPADEQIDAYYRLLEPGRVVRLGYDVVSPSQVKAAVESANMKEGRKEGILHVLRDKLAVTRALVMELSEKQELFTIQASLMNTEKGTVVRLHKIADVRRINLPEEVEAAADSLLKTK